MPHTVSSSTFQELTSELSTDELVKRLKGCCRSLGECESLEDVNSSEFHSLAKTLAQPFLQSHRSREVRGLVSCCIADIFRVCYPDPPYDESQRKLVFDGLVRQLQGLEKPASPAFKYSFQLLETLANIRLFNLCLEMEDQDILTDIFKMMFSVINQDQSTKVKNYIIEILSALVQDGDSLPQEVIDIILSNILEPSKSENKASYSFAVEFIRKTSSHIEPYIHLFFNNALVVGKCSESEVVEHLYELILELHAIDSSVLLAVMPQLEFKLKSADIEERFAVTKLLAQMFSPKTSKLAVENRPLWSCFLGRFSDATPHIRLECIKYAKYFLLHHSHLVEDVTLKLHERFYDREERVRMEVVKVVCEVANLNFEAVPKTLCEDLEGRMRDKVWSIRRECISNVARLYRQMMSSSFSSGGALNSSFLKKLQWIPTKILHSYYRESAEDKLCVERCLLSCIIPVNLPDSQRMERLVHVYNSLEDENAVRAFDALLASRNLLRGYLREIVNSQQMEKRQSILTQVVQLSRHLPDSLKCQGALDSLVKSLDEVKFRESLLKSIDTSCSCGEVMQAKMSVLEKVASRAGLLETMKNVLDRACPMLIDANCIQILATKVCGDLYEPALAASKEEEEEEYERAKKALQLLRNLAKIMPGNFGSPEVFEKLLILVKHDDKGIVKCVLQVLTQTGGHLDKSKAGCLQPVLMQLSLKGDPELAKDAVKCMHTVFATPKASMERLCSSLVSRLDCDDDHLLTVLTSLCQVAKLQPQVFATSHKRIVNNFVVKKLMTVDRAENEFVVGEKEWGTDDEISYEARLKVLGIKLLVNWLLGLVSSLAGAKDMEKNCRAVLKLLDATLVSDGDLQAADNISACDRSRLRLAAACGFIKLAKSSTVRDFIPIPMIQTLVLTVQDTCEEVRVKFMEKLNKGLLSLRLPVSYLAFMVYVGTEPTKSLLSKFRKMVSINVMRRRQYLNQNSKAKDNRHAILPEYAVSHAVYLVAHHAEYSRTDTQQLDKFKECLWFFLEPIVLGGESYGFLVKLLDSIKLTVDAQDPANSEATKNLYSACDLAKGVMEKKLKHLKLGNFSGDVVLPSKLFQSKRESQPNTTTYLPPEYNCTPTKRQPTVRSPNSAAAEAEATPTKKAKPPSEAKEPAKPAKPVGRKAPRRAPAKKKKVGKKPGKPSPSDAATKGKPSPSDAATKGKPSPSDATTRGKASPSDAATRGKASPSDATGGKARAPAKQATRWSGRTRSKGKGSEGNGSAPREPTPPPSEEEEEEEEREEDGDGEDAVSDMETEGDEVEAPEEPPEESPEEPPEESPEGSPEEPPEEKKAKLDEGKQDEEVQSLETSKIRRRARRRR